MSQSRNRSPLLTSDYSHWKPCPSWVRQGPCPCQLRTIAPRGPLDHCRSTSFVELPHAAPNWSSPHQASHTHTPYPIPHTPPGSCSTTPGRIECLRGSPAGSACRIGGQGRLVPSVLG